MSAEPPRPRLHWLLLAALAGSALWCVIGAAVAAVLAAWVAAAILLGAAVALAIVTVVLARPRREPAAPSVAADAAAHQVTEARSPDLTQH